MSKEQTPITFKQFKERGELCEFCGEPTSIASREKHKRGVICSCDWVDKKAEQYANTKVLETLEREKENLERMYLLGRYERGESDKKMDLIDTSKSVIDELLRNRSKTKVPKQR